MNNRFDWWHQSLKSRGTGTTDSSVGFLCLVVDLRAATIRDSPSSTAFSELCVAMVVCKQKRQFVIKWMPWEVALLNVNTDGVTFVLELVTEALFVVSAEKEELSSSHSKAGFWQGQLSCDPEVAVRSAGDGADDVQV